MRKVQIEKAGSYDRLQIVEVADLKAKDNEVLIEVKAAGINYADICIRLGVYESAKQLVGWPITPGFEASGIVKEVGPNVTKYKVGDKVMGFSLFNAQASQVCIPENQVLPLPEKFSMEEGAGFLAVFFTAFHALHQHIFLMPNSKILIHSAAGGVGTALTQLCKAAGHYTVGVIGSSHKKDYLSQFGPDEIIDKSKEDLWSKAKEYAPDGYHAIFDANGFSTMNDSYAHLKPTGKLLVYGSHDLLSKKGGRINYFKAAMGLLKTPKFNPLDMITENKGVIGFNLSFLFAQKDKIEHCLTGLSTMLNDEKIKPIPVKTYKVEDIATAHQHIESGQSVGKLVLTF